MGRHKRDVCYNAYGTHQHPKGFFNCPLRHQNFTWDDCCGSTSEQYCCDMTERLSSIARSTWIVLGLVVVLILLGILGCYIHERHRQRRQPFYFNNPPSGQVAPYPPGDPYTPGSPYFQGAGYGQGYANPQMYPPTSGFTPTPGQPGGPGQPGNPSYPPP